MEVVFWRCLFSIPWKELPWPPLNQGSHFEEDKGQLPWIVIIFREIHCWYSPRSWPVTSRNGVHLKKKRRILRVTVCIIRSMGLPLLLISNFASQQLQWNQREVFTVQSRRNWYIWWFVLYLPENIEVWHILNWVLSDTVWAWTCIV